MSRALYQDMYLTADQVARVRDYLRAVDFHLPGATPDDFFINPRARYLGYMFQGEDLESFGVGLQCTVPGREHERTFIRMSRSQLLGLADATPLTVNPPVLAAEALTLNRFYEKEPQPLRHGPDTYAKDKGLPGADMDLDMLQQQLRDIVAFHNGEPVPGNQEILDLKIFWGCLLAGRYPRLQQLRAKLSAEQAARLDAFEAEASALEGVLQALELPTLETLKTPKREDG